MADMDARYPAAGGKLTGEASEPSNWVGQVDEPDVPPKRTPKRRRSRGKQNFYREPDTRAFGVHEESVYTPVREVEIGGVFVDSDRDITIRASNTGARTLDLTLWNLDSATWQSIDDKKDVRIRLGWRGIETTPVFTGTIVTKRRRRRGADRAFLIRALGKYGYEIKHHGYSRTFNDLPPHRIIEYVIGDTSLGKGYVSRESEPVSGYWAISKHKSLEHWFDQLAQLCTRQTGRQWIWYLRKGDLYFHPADERVTETVELAQEKSLLRWTPVGYPSSVGNTTRELVMRCEPVIRRGLTLSISDVNEIPSSHRFGVKSFIFESSTRTGRHHTSAIAVPLVTRRENDA